MGSTKNDKQDPTLLDGHGAQDAGLSSAMHDIRMLAARYKTDSREAGESLRLAGVTTMQPTHILQPAARRSFERWNGVAFVLLMLLGLSTSALALSLYAEPDSLVEAVFFETENLGHAERQALVSTPSLALPNEEPLHDTPPDETLVETEMTTSRTSKRVRTKRAAVAPKVIRRGRSEIEVAPQIEESFTCDEVACLIDSSDPCCSQYPSVSQQESVLEEHRPYRPNRSTIMKAMREIEGDVLRCFDTHGETGLASVEFVIEASGRVREVELSQGPLAFRACIREHIRTLTFDPLQASFKMSFPFRK